MLDRLVNHVLGTVEIADIIAINYCLATHRLDLMGHFLRRCRITAGAVNRTTQIIDHNLGAMFGE